MTIEHDARKAAAEHFETVHAQTFNRAQLEDAYVDGYRRAISDIAGALNG